MNHNALKPGFPTHTHLCAGVIVYGTPTCSWTRKQRQYFDNNKVPYTLVDCATEKCPDFVEGFPTIVWTGYAEIPLKP
ncbi:MAG: hypothetical protein JW953_17100 [Anaerolineae bacterium]|nr:hypothetical protein [Anaerolineae bacterium]